MLHTHDQYSYKREANSDYYEKQRRHYYQLSEEKVREREKREKDYYELVEEQRREREEEEKK